MLPNIIPGYPSVIDDDVKLFQYNNNLVIDGKIGPQTRKEMWPEDGHGYTHLAWHKVHESGAKDSKAWAIQRFSDTWSSLPLPALHMVELLGILTSGWKTGFDYLSTQDGITFGGRRLAASKLRKFIEDNKASFRIHLGHYNTKSLIENLKDGPNNGWPLNDPDLRWGFIEAARSKDLWEAQIVGLCEDIRRTLRGKNWTSGRMIALAMRARNSSPRYLKGLPADDKEAYKELRKRYLEHPRGSSRIARLEREIGPLVRWK